MLLLAWKHVQLSSIFVRTLFRTDNTTRKVLLGKQGGWKVIEKMVKQWRSDVCVEFTTSPCAHLKLWQGFQ